MMRALKFLHWMLCRRTSDVNTSAEESGDRVKGADVIKPGNTSGARTRGVAAIEAGPYRIRIAMPCLMFA